MNSSWRWKRNLFPGNHRSRRWLFPVFLGLLALIASCLYMGRTNEPPSLQTADIKVETAEADVAEEAPVPETADDAIPEPPASDVDIVCQIQPGDSLSTIFDSISIAQPVLYQILAADESLLALDVLHPGNRLTFTLDQETRVLERMELYIHPGKQVVYRRIDDSTFEYEEVVIPGEWAWRQVSGTIVGSFYRSSMAAGLSEQDTGQIAELFKQKVNFARDIRAGDQFQVLLSEQFIDGEYTGQSHIEGVRIFNRGKVYTAFLYEDGYYYDLNGESLATAFLRYPFRGNYRISSTFSPNRKHPVTGSVSPHNGTDFSMPTGTSVLSTGDGVVTRVKNHPYAGKYIEIQHSGQYVTRYLHLSRILVKKGQTVTRGQLIGKSGNTGRTTGPHLHFELIVNSRPVDPVKAKIPLADAIPENKRPDFDAHCEALLSLMEAPSQQIAMSDADTDQLPP